MSQRRLPRSVRASLGLYGILLWAYPPQFRARYGAEMARLFRDCCRDAYRERGARGVLRLWPGALGDLARTSAQERLAALPRPEVSRDELAHLGRKTAMELIRWRRRLSERIGILLRGRAYPVLAQADSRDRFDKFTERARRTLVFSQDEARGFGHSYIGTEHLLLGLLDEGGGVAALTLRHLGVDVERVRHDVEFVIGRKEEPVTGEIGLTPRSRRIIALAVDEARGLGHHFIGTEHLLLGMIREGEGLGARVLEGAGVRLDAARAETLRVLRATECPPEA